MKRPTRVPASERRQDEQRLEHDGEVIPERKRRLAGDHLGEHRGHADREGRRAAGAADHGRFLEIVGELLHFRPA